MCVYVYLKEEKSQESNVPDVLYNTWLLWRVSGSLPFFFFFPSLFITNCSSSFSFYFFDEFKSYRRQRALNEMWEAFFFFLRFFSFRNGQCQVRFYFGSGCHADAHDAPFSVTEQDVWCVSKANRKRDGKQAKLGPATDAYSATCMKKTGRSRPAIVVIVL